jgi:hypothetical protein
MKKYFLISICISIFIMSYFLTGCSNFGKQYKYNNSNIHNHNEYNNSNVNNKFITLLNNEPGYKIIKDYSIYITRFHSGYNSIFKEINANFPNNANGCVSLKIIYTNAAALNNQPFFGICEYVKMIKIYKNYLKN